MTRMVSSGLGSSALTSPLTIGHRHCSVVSSLAAASRKVARPRQHRPPCDGACRRALLLRYCPQLPMVSRASTQLSNAGAAGAPAGAPPTTCPPPGEGSRSGEGSGRQRSQHPQCTGGCGGEGVGVGEMSAVAGSRGGGGDGDRGHDGNVAGGSGWWTKKQVGGAAAAQPLRGGASWPCCDLAPFVSARLVVSS